MRLGQVNSIHLKAPYQSLIASLRQSRAFMPWNQLPACNPGSILIFCRQPVHTSARTADVRAGDY